MSVLFAYVHNLQYFGHCLLETILISLCSNEFSNIPPQLRSHDAAHTPRQNGLATMNSLCSLGLPSFFLFPQSHVLCGSPICSQLFAKKRFTPYHSPQIANYEQVPIGYLMTMRQINLSFLQIFLTLLAYVHFLLYLCRLKHLKPLKQHLWCA